MIIRAKRGRPIEFRSIDFSFVFNCRAGLQAVAILSKCFGNIIFNAIDYIFTEEFPFGRLIAVEICSTTNLCAFWSFGKEKNIFWNF